jgi:ketosteroid isomerase-like protein
MSENLDLVRVLFAAWGRGDFSSNEWADPEIEFSVAGGVNPITATGLHGMADAFGDYLRAWKSLHVTVDGYREIDDERILVLTQLHGRGNTSGLDLGRIQTKQASLLQIRGGKVTRLVIYNSRENAFADLGLAE